jgi:hypothetical protein
MRTYTNVGYSLAAIGLLVLALACGTGALAVQRRAVDLPRVNVQLGGYRVITAPVTIRSQPPEYYYSVWLFVATYPPRGPRTERGEQVLVVRLGAD